MRLRRRVRVISKVLAIALGLAATACGAERGMIGHWTFDDGKGTVASDSSGAGHHAKVRGAKWTKGRLGGALRFDGDDDYVALGDLGSHAQATVAFWMKGLGLESRPLWQGLVTSDGWEKGVLHLPMGKRRAEVYLHLGEGRRGRLTGPPMRSDRWYHVAVAMDAAAGTMRLYVNGSEEDAADFPRLEAGIQLIRQVVGREFDGKGSSRYFRGLIDDVRIYSRMLGATEVQALCPGAVSLAARDPRNVRAGRRIPDEGYCDQPYVVITKEGHWLCTLTTGPGREGHHGQHIVSTISTDQGRTWSKLVDIEPSDGPEASWVVPLATPGGRVYAFYTYNGDDVRTLKGKRIRADVIGWYAYRYSDDGGRSWSKERCRLPLRLTACDRGNDWGGKVQIFWGIDKPMAVGGSAYFAFTKLGKFMLDNGEGWFYRSDNILTEPDVAKLRWELLPVGDHGLRASEFGSVQEEHNIVPLSGGALYCVYRTSKGHPCHAYSRDGGRTWTKPQFMTYTPGGRRLKTPRACPMVWRTQNGKFLFWFHNQKGRGHHGRNPVWIAGGIEKGGRIHWSQPEILLYDRGQINGMSYPDLIEQDGRYWVTETQKTIARVHEIDKALLEGMWNQGKVKTVTRAGLVLSLGPEGIRGGKAALPKPLDLEETTGVSIELWLTLADLRAGQVILDGRDAKGRGMALSITKGGAIRLVLSDGSAKAAWDCDPGLLQPRKRHHVVAIVDAGPRLISFVVDGLLCDGGPRGNCGWTRYDAALGDISGSGKLKIAPSFTGELSRLRVYRRYLRTSEAIANFHAGP